MGCWWWSPAQRLPQEEKHKAGGEGRGHGCQNGARQCSKSAIFYPKSVQHLFIFLSKRENIRQEERVEAIVAKMVPGKCSKSFIFYPKKCSTYFYLFIQEGKYKAGGKGRSHGCQNGVKQVFKISFVILYLMTTVELAVSVHKYFVRVTKVTPELFSYASS